MKTFIYLELLPLNLNAVFVVCVRIGERLPHTQRTMIRSLLAFIEHEHVIGRVDVPVIFPAGGAQADLRCASII